MLAHRKPGRKRFRQTKAKNMFGVAGHPCRVAVAPVGVDLVRVLLHPVGQASPSDRIGDKSSLLFEFAPRRVDQGFPRTVFASSHRLPETGPIGPLKN